MVQKSINLKISKRISENNLNYIFDQSNENQIKTEFEQLITQLKNNIKLKIEIKNLTESLKCCSPSNKVLLDVNYLNKNLILSKKKVNLIK